MRSKIVILILFFLTACSTSASMKQLEHINSSVLTLQSNVESVKKQVKKTSDSIAVAKREQPHCNLAPLEQEIELIDVIVEGLENNLSVLRQQTALEKDIIKVEMGHYRHKYIGSRIVNFGLLLLIGFLVFNKLNAGKIISWCGGIFRWFRG